MHDEFKFAEMNALLNGYEYWCYEKKYNQTFDLAKSDSSDSKDPDVVTPGRNWRKIMASPQYELVINVLGIMNVLCIVVREGDFTETRNYIEKWIYLQFAINAVFFIELVADIWVHGFFKCYEIHFRAWPETAC